MFGGFAPRIIKGELEHLLEPIRVVDLFQKTNLQRRSPRPITTTVTFYVQTCTDETTNGDYQPIIQASGRVQRLRFIRTVDRDCEPDRLPFQKLLQHNVAGVRDMRVVPLLIHNPVLKSVEGDPLAEPDLTPR